MQKIGDVKMETSSSGSASFLGLLLFGFLASGWIYGDQVKIKTENGVTVVYNPKDPALPPGVPTGGWGQSRASETSVARIPGQAEKE
jgi:hypothetical protein